MTFIQLAFFITQSIVMPDQANQEYSFYKVVFQKIDNKAEIYVGDSLIYESDTIDFNPRLSKEINVYDYYYGPVNEITIKLYNGGRTNNPEIKDSHWEIKYELFKDDEPIDYIWEVPQGEVTMGLVFEKTYDLK